MADEITLTSGMVVSKTGGVSVTVPSATNRVDMAGNYATTSVQSVGFSAHELLVISADLATAGYAMFKNLDATNYVEIGTDVSAAFNAFLKLLPGESAGPMPLATTAIYAKANTAAVKLQYTVVER